MMANATKFFLFLIVSFLSLATSYAQTNYTDVVYLKNGGIIRGMIIEQIPNQSIKIQTKDKNIFVYKMDEIEKIAKEERGSHSAAVQPASTNKNNARYILWFESNIGIGISDSTRGSMTMCGHAINGVLINNQFAMGMGVGFDIDNTDLNSFFTASFFIDLRYCTNKKDITPLFVAQLGYSGDGISTSDVTRSGLLFNGGVGGRFKIGNRSAINLTLNYKFQDLRVVNNYYYGGNNNQNVGDYKLHYLGITFGISL